MTTAIYIRVSTKQQDMRSQEADLMAYKTTAEEKGEKVTIYRDKATGKNFKRPGWEKLWAAVLAGKVKRVVVWRLDRLGRMAGETIALLDDLHGKGVAFLSIRDGFDSSTPTGRLLRNMLASFAQFETEVRYERQMAGIADVRKKNGGRCPWGGKKPRKPNASTQKKLKRVRELHAQGSSIAEIARSQGLTRQTIYRLLEQGESTAK